MIENTEDLEASREPDEALEQSAEDASLHPEEGGEPAQEPAEQDFDGSGKPRSEKRISQLTARARRAERNAEYWRAQAITQQPQRPPAKPEPEPDEPEPKPPKLADFDGNLEKFAEAQTQYVQDVRVYDRSQAQKAEERREHEAAERERQSKLTEQQQRQVSMLERGMEAHEDYEDVVFVRDLPITNEMLEVASDMENGEEVLYVLGKNRDEASRISKLSGRAVTIEMAKLAAGSPTPPRNRNSGAPPPPRPPKGGGDSADSGDELRDDLPTEKWAQNFRKRLDKRRQAR